MPTKLQKKRIKKVLEGSLENMVEGKEPNVKAEVLKQGYSKSYAESGHITRTRTWRQLLSLIDEQGIIENLNQIATDPSGKRDSISAASLLFKIKDRMPANKLKIGQYEQELQSLILPENRAEPEEGTEESYTKELKSLISKEE